MKTDEAKDYAKLYMRHEHTKDLLRRIRQDHRDNRRSTKLANKHVKDINQIIGET